MEPELPEPTAQLAPTFPADDAKIARLRRRARRLWYCYRIGSIMGSLGLGMMFLVGLVNMVFGIGPTPPLLSLSWIICMSVGSVISLLRFPWKRTAQTLASTARVETIGAFIEGLSVTQERMFALVTLLRLLPSLQASDAHLLSTKHHRTLNHVLNRKSLVEDTQTTALRFAILKAYEQVGNAEDLPVVERLAAGQGYAKRDRRIREAAQNCLPYLQVRSEQQAARQTLLRPSSPANDNGVNLLRPASGTSETDAQLLLRAANSNPLD